MIGKCMSKQSMHVQHSTACMFTNGYRRSSITNWAVTGALYHICVIRSTLQDSDITADLHATTVVALLEHLGLQDVTLVMHVWGGKAAPSPSGRRIPLRA